MNDAAIAPSSSSQPTPSATRAPSRAADQPRRQEQRAEPAGDRDAGEQPQPADLAVARLPLQLEPQRALGALALRLELLALELEPTRVAIERFLQRGDDDAGQPRFEAAGRPRRRPRAAAAASSVVRRAAALRPAREIGDAERRVDELQPRNRHLLRSQPAIAERLLRRRSARRPIRPARRRCADPRRASRSRSSPRRCDRRTTIGTVSPGLCRCSTVATSSSPVDPLAVDLLQLVVLVEAGGVDRPGRRDRAWRRASRRATRAADRRARRGPELRLRSDEPGARQQARVVGDLVALDVAGEEVARERAVAADRRRASLRRRRSCTDDRRSLRGCRPACRSVRHIARMKSSSDTPAVGAIAQRQVERQRDRAAERVVRDHRGRPVGAIDRRGRRR